jgi:hypothetical protein
MMMDEHVHPAHECECCGCDSASVFTDPDDGAEFQVCNRCLFVVGSEMQPLDDIIGTLWTSHDIRGTPYSEDIHAMMQEQQGPEETYEVPEQPSLIESKEVYERSIRMHEAMDIIQECAPDAPEDEMGSQEGPYDPGIEFYMP